MVSAIKPKPSLSLYILTSFTISFLLARIITSINPDLTLVSGGYHIHHFWYGLAMLSLGGWIGINYSGQRLDRFSAIIFGAGGGLVGDEIGLLLTLGNYYESITYTLVVSIIIIISGGLLLNRFRNELMEELTQVVQNRIFLSFSLVFTIIAIGFSLESSNQLIINISLILVPLLLILMLVNIILLRKGRGSF